MKHCYLLKRLHRISFLKILQTLNSNDKTYCINEFFNHWSNLYSVIKIDVSTNIFSIYSKGLNKRGNIKYQLLELIGENSVYSLYDWLAIDLIVLSLAFCWGLECAYMCVCFCVHVYAYICVCVHLYIHICAGNFGYRSSPSTLFETSSLVYHCVN